MGGGGRQLGAEGERGGGDERERVRQVGCPTGARSTGRTVRRRRLGGPTTRSATWWPPGWPAWVGRCSRSTRRSDRGRAPSSTSTGPPGRWRRPSGPGAWARAGRGHPAPQLGRGRHGLLGGRLPRCGGRARRALLRRQRGRVHPSVTSPDVLVTAERFGHNDYLATYTELLADGRSRRGWWWATPPPPTCPRRHPVRRPARGAAHRRAGRRRSRNAGHRGLHLGHHSQPQGSGALPPDHRMRDRASSTTCSLPGGRRRSLGPRWATSSACSTPS